MGVGPGEVRVRESGRLLLTEGSVEGPNDQVVYSFRTADDMEGTHDQTEGFQERVEPPIIDLESALGCEPSEDAISLTELFTAWPAGTEFEVLATEKGGNQTITEGGVFCTPPIAPANCELP